MNDEALVASLIERLLAKRPDLWYSFRDDPLGSLEEAGIRVTDAERAAVERAGQLADDVTTPSTTASDPLVEALKADLAEARKARELDFNPFATGEEKAETLVDDTLLEEQRRLTVKMEALRASLAEERQRLAQEKAAALRRLGGKDGSRDKKK